VTVHEVIEKVTGAVVRCSVDAAATDRWIEIPGWMLDPATCPSGEVASSAVVDVTALVALVELLRVSRAKHAAMDGAPCTPWPNLSAETTRGEGHDERNKDFRTRPSPPGSGRSIRGRLSECGVSAARLAGPADPSAANGDRLAFKAAARTRRSRRRADLAGGRQ
jgi:hypothetical protein